MVPAGGTMNKPPTASCLKCLAPQAQARAQPRGADEAYSRRAVSPLQASLRHVRRWRIALMLMLSFLAGCFPSATDERMKLLNDDGVRLYRQSDYRNASESFEMALELSP